MRFIPQSACEESPHPFAALVPGSGGLRAISAMGDEKLLAYARAAAAGAELVASVGSGALILGHRVHPCVEETGGMAHTR